MFLIILYEIKLYNHPFEALKGTADPIIRSICENAKSIVNITINPKNLKILTLTIRP